MERSQTSRSWAPRTRRRPTVQQPDLLDKCDVRTLETDRASWDGLDLSERDRSAAGEDGVVQFHEFQLLTGGYVDQHDGSGGAGRVDAGVIQEAAGIGLS